MSHAQTKARTIAARVQARCSKIKPLITIDGRQEDHTLNELVAEGPGLLLKLCDELDALREENRVLRARERAAAAERLRRALFGIGLVKK